tara:strand:+ start:320 stop:2848 length:2529 start_codon:yes stop_codon:yes gene_type:complete
MSDSDSEECEMDIDGAERYEMEQESHGRADEGVSMDELFGGAEPGNPRRGGGDEDEDEDEREREPLLSPPVAGGYAALGCDPRAPGMGDASWASAVLAQQQRNRQGQAGPSGVGHLPNHDDACSESSLAFATNGGGGGGGGGLDTDSQSTGTVHADDLTYPGFDESIFRVQDAAKPLLRSSGDLWTPLTRNLGPREMRPKRAMRIPIISDFFRRDAEFFKQWQLPKGHESRARATAALVSLLFAGTAMGLISGDHEEKKRLAASEAELDAHEAQGGGGGGGGGGAGKKKDAPPLRHVHRYTYVPGDDSAESYPMFQIGLEELYHEAEEGAENEQTEVLALAVWLFIYDESHSTSHLVSQVIRNTRSLNDAGKAAAARSGDRDKNAVAEASRLDKAACGFADLDANFEKNAGLQFKRVVGTDELKLILNLHSGKSSQGPGRPCVADLAQHVNCAAGRREFHGDNRTNCGGRHPLAPEFLLNAKRREGLEFGLVGLDGENLNVCAEQLNPKTYFGDDGYFRVPEFQKTCFWICTSTEVRTPFELPLTRPLQGTVLPGNDLMRLFVEEDRRAKNVEGGDPDAEVPEATDADVDQTAYMQLRSVMTRKDEWQRAQDQMLRNTIHAYDTMSAQSGPGGLELESVNNDANAEQGEANYTLKTVSMTERVTRETDRLWTRLVQPWQSRIERELNDMQARIEKAEYAEQREQTKAAREAAVKTRQIQREEESQLSPSLASVANEMRDARVGAAEGAEGADDDDDDMELDYSDVEAMRESDSWDDFDAKRAAFQTKLYRVKRDVVRYHCKLLKSCFLSTKDSATLPAGYKARACIRTSTHLTHYDVPSYCV